MILLASFTFSVIILLGFFEISNFLICVLFLYLRCVFRFVILKYFSINETIKKERHTEYLKKVLDDYEKYKEIFSAAFTHENPLDAIYTFRASYILKTPVWRDIAILGSQTFCDLAETIIESMGWDNDYMHCFSVKKINGKVEYRYSPFSMYAPGWEDDPYPTYKTDEVKIADIDYSQHPKWNFVFDFGDGHEFDIELRKIDKKVDKKDFNEPLPTCIDQRGVAPLQYPPLPEEDAVYADGKKWGHDDNCPHCQTLKKTGVELQWFPDKVKN